MPLDPKQSTYLTCRVCGRDSPDARGLHKHLQSAHDVKAWDYYMRHLDVLRERIAASIVAVSRVDGIGVCWEFQGRDNRRGYRDMRVAGAPTTLVHRLALLAWNGELPATELKVLHQCDNPACCRPEHLKVGTHQENMDERAERDRTSRGEDHAVSKLDADAVQHIRLWTSWGFSRRSIAEHLEVSSSTIDHVVNGRCWQHVPYDPQFDGNFIPW